MSTEKKNKQSIFEFEELREGIFLTRPNRFVGVIKYNGVEEKAHIHDPGRLKELLIRSAKVLFTDSNGKLKYYIKAVKTIDNEWVLIDSAIHSKLAMEIFKLMPEFKRTKEIKKEVKIGRSRIDFMLDGIPLEVKGVSLVIDGLALFPDAPTERGTRHVREIIEYEGMILFLVFRKAKKFAPYAEMDLDFANALKEAKAKKRPIYAVQLSFDGKTIYYNGRIPLADF
ncbi:MAG: DNA/RNA nuclease SfsA [Promethearchaeota archaeon]